MFVLRQIQSFDSLSNLKLKMKTSIILNALEKLFSVHPLSPTFCSQTAQRHARGIVTEQYSFVPFLSGVLEK